MDQLIVVARRIAVQGELGVSHPVERIRRIPQVPLVRFPVGFIVGPEVEIISPKDRGRHTVLLEQSIRTLQIHPLVPLIPVVRLLVRVLPVLRQLGHMPDQQPTPGYVPIVVSDRRISMFDQEVLAHRTGPPVPGQGNSVHRSPGPHGPDHHIHHVLPHVH